MLLLLAVDKELPINNNQDAVIAVFYNCNCNTLIPVKVKVVKLVFQTPKHDFDQFDLDHFDIMMPVL